jgi:hypothetical protein
MGRLNITGRDGQESKSAADHSSAGIKKAPEKVPLIILGHFGR